MCVGGYPPRYAIIRVFPRYSIRIHPLTEALPHFVTGGVGGGVSLPPADAIVRHPVLHELHRRSPLLAVVSCY